MTVLTAEQIEEIELKRLAEMEKELVAKKERRRNGQLTEQEKKLDEIFNGMRKK